jgi:nitrogenase molybdenum-cofactor synthesis protein NifE
MNTNIDKLTDKGCSTDTMDKVCRSRGGESCAFDGAMIVLQPIADTAHIVHGPISCCGNTWEGRGTLSSKGNLHKMGFTTDMSEMDIVYGSEEKLYKAIIKTYEAVKPKAIFVYSTCVSGLIGEDLETICRKAETALGIRVVPVNAPGFVGPKNLGNRIAGEVLLDYVIGTGEPQENSHSGNHNSPYPPLILRGGAEGGGVTLKSKPQGVINLIGEYNIAGDLWLVEPVLNAAGIRILSRITGDSTFEEITYAHKAKLNVVVCSRALINVAKEMEKKYGIPYIEVSFFGKTEMSKALRAISCQLSAVSCQLSDKIEEVITIEEQKLIDRLRPYEHLKGKKAVLYSGGVKSWSFISALLDLGIETVAVGTKKSTFEDEEKMKSILGENAPLVEDATPKNLLRLLKERNADILVAGGRNQYLAVKEGYPFVDVNQERHTAYAGYDGLVNLAEEISNSLRFYAKGKGQRAYMTYKTYAQSTGKSVFINPLKHSQSIGAAMAFQGIHNAIPVIHGSQGCTFLGKVLLTKHFREPIALASTKLFTEDVVMGSYENVIKVVKGFTEKNVPDIIGILTSGLSEIKGDDIRNVVNSEFRIPNSEIIYVSTPDYEGGLETGYAKAVEAVIESIVARNDTTLRHSGLSGIFPMKDCRQAAMTDNLYVNVLAGSHLTPADFTELREIIEAFGLRSIILPDLSALDGSRQGVSALATGGTTIEDIETMRSSQFTLAIGMSMETPARKLKDRFGIEYKIIESISGLKDSDMLMETLSMLSSRPIPLRYVRQRRVLLDGMRDAHFLFGSKKICLALEPDMAIQTSRWLDEMGVKIRTIDVNTEDLFSIEGDYDLIISNSHAEDTARKIGAPLYQMGFPVFKVLGNTSKVTTGYRGTLTMVNDVANLLMDKTEKDKGVSK